MLGKIEALRGTANRWQSGDDLHVCAWDGEDPVRIDISISDWQLLCDRFNADLDVAVAALGNLASRSDKVVTIGLAGYTVRAALS